MKEESGLQAGLSGLLEKTVELFEGDAEMARAWLERPCKGLGGQAPLEVAETESGIRAMEDLIGRLEHGVFT